MKFRNVLITTGFVVSVGVAYITGYNNGIEDMQPKLVAVSNEATDYLKEVRHLNELNKALVDANDYLLEQLERPVYLSDMDVTFNKNFNVAKFRISAYSPYDDRNGINSDGNPNSTATGTKPGPGTFAVDPNIIPYGSEMIILYPDGTVERGRAEDTGGAIKNYRIDVFRHTYASAMKFGIKDATVIWYKQGGE
ncbi:MAG: hypothetical protein GX664_04195 [Bacteroidales bacterium]|nr:hypothetical protein [Bacteroidales bacterium]